MTDHALFWNDIAEKYARTPVADPEAFERKIAATKACMRPEHHVLDIGCGTGSLALRLAPHAAHVHGLDIAHEMVRIAREKAASASVENVTFHLGAFDDTLRAFAPQSLDGICAYSILHLVDDRAAALARIYDLLAPGGFFVSSTTCLGESWVPYRPVLAVMRAIGKAPRVTILRKDALVDAMRAAGFVDVEQPDVGANATIAFVVARKPVDGGGR